MIPSLEDILQILSSRGLLRNPKIVRVLSGNADRHLDRRRVHALIENGPGARIKLTIGTSLEVARSRSLGFWKIFPELATREIFFTAIETGDVWATEAVEGPSLEDLAEDGSSAARILSTLWTVERIYAVAEEPSTEGNLSAEWQAFSAAVFALKCWSPNERGFLERDLVPNLLTLLRPTSACRRWTNGDFISQNILLGLDGKPVVLDAEYGSLTHFFREDEVRFLRISPICIHHPGLLAGWWPKPEPAWEIFFQLRQLVLEHAENEVAYLRAATPLRKAAIRFHGNTCLGTFPPDCPLPIDPAPGFDADMVQLFWRSESQDWSEQQSTRVYVRAGIRQFAGFRLRGDFPHWRLDPVATNRTVHVHSITAVSAQSTDHQKISPDTILGAHVDYRDDGIRLRPHAADPQLYFSIPTDSIGLVVELHTFIA